MVADNRVAIFIPTYNAGSAWQQFFDSIKKQTTQPGVVAIIDSGSTDDTVPIARKNGAVIHHIDKREFTHGGARHRLTEAHPDHDFYVFLTQDAILASPDSIANIIAAFNDPETGVAYGRQLPYPDAGILEKHNRLFNYPPKSHTRSLADVPVYGFKTIFCSNSFAAYRREAYVNAGGFPREAFFGEDTLLTGKLLEDGWKIAYVAEAPVYHSHNYGLKQEYARYSDIGRFHRHNQWLYQKFGKPSGEGIRFVLSEVKYVLSRNPLYVFAVGVRSLNKWLGFKAGFKAE